jgi:hypothetical protein
MQKTYPQKRNEYNGDNRSIQAERVSMESKNASLQRAAKAKADEFYTQLPDIEAELRHYKEHFNGKKILCNCDDPFESNFFKYFSMNFNYLGLAKLTATSYVDSPIAEGQLPLFEVQGLGVRQGEGKKPYKMEITEVRDEDGNQATDLTDVELLLKNQRNALSLLDGDGDFRSRECIEFLKEADIVVTNPPFSLFREFVAQLVEYDKKFIIIGNVNAIGYKETSKLIKNGQVWLGPSIHSGDREFRVPDHYPLEAASFRVDENGVKYLRVKGVRWFTNLDFKERHENITFYRRYNPKDYPRYVNYDAIEVPVTSDIPYDYPDEMGVPITFLDKFNPDQFEIIGSSGELAKPMSDIAEEGTYVKGGPSFYLAQEDGTYRRLYKRLVIKRKGARQ